jgi:hypothetical protein
MSTAAQIAAARINSARAGLTGPTALPENEPGAPQGVSPVEVASLIPTEFGGLTHLFGGNAEPSTQYEPVNPSLTASGGVAGKLGGLKPDVRTATQAVTRSTEQARTAVVPISTAARNTVTRIRQALKI